MNNNVLTQTIADRQRPTWSAGIQRHSREINKASHPSQPQLNWKLVESLALSIFRKRMVWICTLRRTINLGAYLHAGLAGFCEGTELLGGDD